MSIHLFLEGSCREVPRPEMVVFIRVGEEIPGQYGIVLGLRVWSGSGQLVKLGEVLRQCSELGLQNTVSIQY
jgi:hypothetical protein